MRPTFPLSILSLVIGLFIMLFSVTLMGTSITDIGMLSTSFVFLLFGVLGLLLHRVQVANASP